MFENDEKIKEIELKAIEFFNIPKDIADNPKLKFSDKILLSVSLEEYFKNGIEDFEDPKEIEASLDRFEKELFEKLKMFEKEIGLNSKNVED